VTLASFTAENSGTGVVLSWESVTESDNAGFNVYRAASPEGPWTRLNETLIASAAPGSVEGRVYQWLDAAPVGQALYYQLEDVALDGMATRHGPVLVTLAGPTAVAISSLAATSTGTGGLPVVAGALALLAAAAGAWLLRRRATLCPVED
jgi:hypothetical protein